MRRCHILSNFEKRMPRIRKSNKLQLTYKQGLLSFCNLIKLMLNACIKVLMTQSCFYVGYYSSSSESLDVIHVSTAASFT